MFESLEITTNIGCSNGCRFCPQSTLVSTYPESDPREMSIEVFNKCLETVPKHVRIHFSGYSEPLMASQFSSMLINALVQDRDIYLFTTLVGLDEEKMDCIRYFHPLAISVHVPDLVGFRYPADKWIELYELFKRASPVNADYSSMTELVDDGIRSRLMRDGHEVSTQTMISRAGLIKEKQIERLIGGNIYCLGERWHRNVLLPNGDVIGCCMGYDMKPILGNLLRQSHEEIYKAADEWKNSDHENDGCRMCEFARVT